MKRKTVVTIALLTLILALPFFSLVVCAKLADLHVLVKAEKLHADVNIDGFRFVDDIIVEVKAQGQESSLTGRGSVHGIYCHATFFLDDLEGMISGNDLILGGSISNTNAAYHSYFRDPVDGWIGTPVELRLNTLTNEMTVTIAGFIEFTGTGRAVQN